MSDQATGSNYRGKDRTTIYDNSAWICKKITILTLAFAAWVLISAATQSLALSVLTMVGGVWALISL